KSTREPKEISPLKSPSSRRNSRTSSELASARKKSPMADVKEIVTGETQPIVKDDWPQSFLDYIKELEEQIAEEQRISASTRQAQIDLNRDRLRLQARVRELEEALKTTCNERDRALAAYMNKESAERERLRTQLEAMT